MNQDKELEYETKIAEEITRLNMRLRGFTFRTDKPVLAARRLLDNIAGCSHGVAIPPPSGKR